MKMRNRQNHSLTFVCVGAVMSGLLGVWLFIHCPATDAAQQKPPALTVTDTVSQHGVTWKFSEKVRVGRFVNGDYYVVGPVTIVSITPKPENDRNGSVLNLPTDPGKSGFDSRVAGGRFDPKMRANPPIQMKPGDALISSISVEQMRTFPPRFVQPTRRSVRCAACPC